MMSKTLVSIPVLAAAVSVIVVGPAGIGRASTPPTSTAPSAVTTASPASTESDHAQVVAQGLIDFPDGRFTWTATAGSSDSDGTQVDAPGSQFVLGDTGRMLVTSGDGRGAILEAGEAIFDPRSLPVTLQAIDGPAGYWSILLTSSPDAGGGIEPGAGVRDVNLVRDVLGPGEVLSVPSDLPQFVLVTAGAVTPDGGTAIAAGSGSQVAGGTSLANDATRPAVVVVAVIGDRTVAAVTTPATTASTATTVASTGTTVPDNSVPNNTEPVAPAQFDSDGDGLSDEDEIVIGSDVNKADTDGDGLSDYEEASGAFNSDPTDPDSDDDGLTDGEEADLGTDAGAKDTDGDGLYDNDEIIGGTNPLDPASNAG